MKHRMIVESYDADDPLDYDTKHRACTDIIWISEEQYQQIIAIATVGLTKVGRMYRKNGV